MIKSFLVERRSWILLFLAVHGLFLFIAYIDPTIPFMSILYIVFLSVIIFVVFLTIRYRAETEFFRMLEEWDGSYDRRLDEEASRPLEKVMQERLLLQEMKYKDGLTAFKRDLEREKDEVMAWMHEVKTPLTTMKLMIERMSDHQFKQLLMVEWLRIDLLLDQQLHQKRIPFIENDYSIQKLHMKPLITEEVKKLQSWCMQKEVGFDIDLKVEEVLCDETWLRFIVRQILTNAVKYSTGTNITIESKFINEQIQLIIKDKGKGIVERDIPRIFDKGFTSTSGKRDQAATGMGLYLVQKVATHLSITINVKSKLHAGTTMYITFPKKNDFIDFISM